MEENIKKETSGESISGIQQHEDAVLKISMQFFADELLPYFKIEGKVLSFAPTELIHLELKKCFRILILLWKMVHGSTLSFKVGMKVWMA